jgi:hypothetical protein
VSRAIDWQALIAGSRTARRLRKKVEMLFAHLKRIILKLDRLRLRGPKGARDEFLLAATAQNLRKLAKLIPMPSRALCDPGQPVPRLQNARPSRSNPPTQPTRPPQRRLSRRKTYARAGARNECDFILKRPSRLNFTDVTLKTDAALHYAHDCGGLKPK